MQRAHDIFARNSTTLERVAKNLRAIRMYRYGYTLSKVSEDTGIPKGTLGVYEFDGQISDTRLEQLAEYYGIPTKEFIRPESKFYEKYIKHYMEG